MVWEGLVYKVLRISLGEHEDCDDSQVLCPEVRRCGSRGVGGGTCWVDWA